MSPNSTWIKCSDSLPECLHESDEHDMMVSHAVLVTDECDPSTLGFAQVREDGTWKLFGGDHDFMHPVQVTHWQPLPRSPAMEKPKVNPGLQNQVSDPDAPLHYYALTFTGTHANGPAKLPWE